MVTQGAHLVWMDLEMTGLDPNRERIIEIATVITDSNLNIVAQGPELVVWQPDELLSAMDDWNKAHHGASGLIDRVRASSIKESVAEKATLEIIKRYCGEREAPLAGNSIHHDRLFLKKYMPQLESYLHYRNVDVSTVKELVRRWNPPVFARRPQKKAAHRAMDDLIESLEELKYYRLNAFLSSPSGDSDAQ